MSGKQYYDEMSGILVEKDDDTIIIQLDIAQANKVRCLVRDYGYPNQDMRGLARILYTVLSEED